MSRRIRRIDPSPVGSFDSHQSKVDIASFSGSGSDSGTLFLVALLMAACVGPRMLGDGTSISVGTHGRGTIRRAARLPEKGSGYLIPPEWRDRKRNYSTDELIQLVARTARRIAKARPKSLLGIADMSQQAGGESPEHKSHHSGRDVDLLPYSVDIRGKPLPPPEHFMVQYAPDGTPKPAAAGSDAGWELRRFDDARNWLLIRALLTDPVAPVQWIFVNDALKRRILRYAERQGETQILLQQAAMVLHQPSDAQAHADHFHVRIYCAPEDRALGCSDKGPERWLKKDLSLHFASNPFRWEILARLLPSGRLLSGSAPLTL